MGCDIHMCVETLKDDKWVNVDFYVKNIWRSIRLSDYAEAGIEFKPEPEFRVVQPYSGRCYTLFGILADVRRRSWTPEAPYPPRGVPEDCSKETAEEIALWGEDGHSHSWLTYKELEEISNIPIFERGMVSLETAEKLDNNGVLPEVWADATSSPSWVQREWPAVHVKEQIDNILKNVRERMHAHYFYKINKEQVRIVFWFDN